MRRIFAIAMVLGASAGAAAADECYRGPGTYLVCGVERPHRAHAAAWYEATLGWSRFDVGPYRADGELLRVGPRVAFGPLFYLGAEADFGHVSSVNNADGSTTSAFGRTASGNGEMAPSAGGLGGSFGAVKLLAGIHANAGIISGAAELAGGLRLAELTSDYTGVVASGDYAVVEGRARLDLWLTPKVTIGALAGVDLTDRDNVTVAVTVGLHFHRFDRSR